MEDVIDQSTVENKLELNYHSYNPNSPIIEDKTSWTNGVSHSQLYKRDYEFYVCSFSIVFIPLSDYLRN